MFYYDLRIEKLEEQLAKEEDSVMASNDYTEEEKMALIRELGREYSEMIRDIETGRE